MSEPAATSHPTECLAPHKHLLNVNATVFAIQLSEVTASPAIAVAVAAVSLIVIAAAGTAAVIVVYFISWKS